MSKLYGTKYKREQLRSYKGRAFLDDKKDNSGWAASFFNSEQSKKKKLLEPGYCESVVRKANQSNLNTRLRGKPITLPTVSIQDDN